jgi:hypothetical protein
MASVVQATAPALFLRTGEARDNGPFHYTPSTPRLAIRFHEGTYHDFHEKQVASGSWRTPDLVVAYNSGVHQSVEPGFSGSPTESPWAKTIALLGKLQVPTVFTCYTEEEAHLGVKAVRAMSIMAGGKGKYGLSFGPERNPFRSLEMRVGTRAGSLGDLYHESGWWFGLA